MSATSSRAASSARDARLQAVGDLFNTFKDPFIYAIGDNEWTDCHRANNGGYNPLDRLAKVRSLIFSIPGQVLGGRNKSVEAQADYPENQLWIESRVTFAVFHIIGSNNGLDQWFGDRRVNGVSVPETPAEGASRVAEVTARQAANIAWLERGSPPRRRRTRSASSCSSRPTSGIPAIRRRCHVHGAPDVGRPLRAAGEQLNGQDPPDRRRQPRLSRRRRRAVDEHLLRRTRAAERHADRRGPQHRVAGDGRGKPSVIEWLRLHVDPRSPDVFSWEQVIVQ